MNRIAAARGAFNAFGSISCMLIVKCIWTCNMEFALYKLIIIIIIIKEITNGRTSERVKELILYQGILNSSLSFVCLFVCLFVSKASFDEWTDWFPNNEALDQKQRKYLADIKAKHEWRFTVRNERKVRGLLRLWQRVGSREKRVYLRVLYARRILPPWLSEGAKGAI